MRKYTKKRVVELIVKYGTPVSYIKGIPLFKAIRNSPYQMKMFCSFCESWHLHGISESVGHRVAHCGTKRMGRKIQNWNESPFYNTGYYIFLVDGEEK